MEPNVTFKGKDIINGYDFNNQELCKILDTAAIYEKRVKSGEVDQPPFYGPGAMLVNSEFRQRSGPRFEGRAAARRGSNAA